MKYDDFDLQIEPAGDKYRVRLLNAPTGQATTEFVLPFTEIEVANFLSRIGQVRRTMRRVDAPELQAAKEFGGKLFGAVFSGEMIAQLRGSMEQASDKEHGLRIRLRLTDVPALADLPWEFLYDANQNHFLTTSSETPVVRFLDLPQRIAPLRVALPLRVLVMIASPRNLKRLDTEGEWVRLQESLGDLLMAGQLILERLPSATLDALRLRARGAPFHVFHFIGHGGFDEAAQDGVLQFEDESEMSYPVRGEMLGMQLHDHRSLRLAVLNACEGARSSRQDPFSGVAQSLLQQRVPAVIAMQFEISDGAAKVFAKEFYRAVAEGNPVDAAVCESRKALFKEEFGQEWATPVLYMRSQEGQLFELQAVAVAPPPFADESLKKRQAEEAERLAVAKVEAESQAKEKAAATELQEARKAEAERAAKAEKTRRELEKREQERLAHEKADADLKASAKAASERQAAQKAAADRAAKAEQERLAREAGENARIARQQEETERRVREHAAFEKLQSEKAQADRQAQEKKIAAGFSAHHSDEIRSRPGRRVWLALLGIPVLGLAVWLAHAYELRRIALQNPEVHFQKAMELRAQKAFHGAANEFREAIRLKPDYAVAHAGLAGTLADIGELDNAIAEYRAVVRLNPGDAPAHEALGGLLLKKGDQEGARAEYLAVTLMNVKPSDALRKAANDLSKEDSAPGIPNPALEAPPKKDADRKAGPARIRQGGNVQAAKLIHRVNPTYPPLAAQAHVAGTVRLHAVIGKDGTVREVDALAGHPLLLQSAMTAVRQWRYSPTRLNGQPVEVDTTIDVEYTLSNLPATPTKADAPVAAVPAPGPPPANATPPPKGPCTFGKIDYTEQGNMLIGSVPYTYQGSYPLDAVAVRGVALSKDRKLLPGLTYAQSTLKTATGTAQFSIEGHPSLGHQDQASDYLLIAIVVKQTGGTVCGEIVPYQRKW